MPFTQQHTVRQLFCNKTVQICELILNAHVLDLGETFTTFQHNLTEFHRVFVCIMV